MTVHPPRGPTDDRLYTRQFFQVFAAVVLFMAGFALQFHFGEYVAYLGYGVDTLGWVLGISMVGALAVRLHIGRWIDRFGCRPTWLVGTAVFVLAVGSLQFVRPLWAIVVLRTVGNIAVAAVMTTVAVFAAAIAPPARKAESLGTIGLAGFLGMIVGPTMGDWVFAGPDQTMLTYRIFFTASAVCALSAGLIIRFIDLPEASGPVAKPDLDAGPAAAPRSSQVRVILAHWPGMVLLVAVAFSSVFTLQITFLERLAEARGFEDIKLFFLTYGPTAIVLRIVFRRLPQRLGRSRTLVGGMILQGIGVLGLVGIDTQWQLVLPAMLMGAGHCFIFPSMVDLGAQCLPPEHRGTGTSTVLGAGDLGVLIGLIVLGRVIEQVGYDAALQGLAATVLVTAILFTISQRQHIFGRRQRSDV
ncbi:MAG: MFS transporter [Planctomycetes bacterium]|nr:MFS transporter [Planctomycetota bacterium]